MFNGRRVNTSSVRSSQLSRRVRSLPRELQDMVLQRYLQGIHARSNARRGGYVRVRRQRVSRGARSYARVRVRQLRRRR